MRTTWRRSRREPIPAPDFPGWDRTEAAVDWDLSRGLRALWRWRAGIVAFVIVVTALAAVYLWRQPDVYTASATLLPNQPAERLASLATLGNVSAMALGGQFLRNDVRLYPTVLQSRLVIEPILSMPMPVRSDQGRQATLQDILQTQDPELGCTLVRRMMSASVDPSTGVCRLAVTMQDPVTAAAVCNALVRALSEGGVTISTSGARQLRHFLSQRLDEVKGELTQAERRLEGFRNQNRNYNRAASPDLELEDDRLVREVTLKSGLYLRLSENYEMARMEEKRDIGNVQILDSAFVPTARSGPHRVRSTIMAGITAGPMAAAVLLLWHFLRLAFSATATEPVSPAYGLRRRLSESGE